MHIFLPALLIPIQAFPHTLSLGALAAKSLLLLDAVPSLWPLWVPGMPAAQDDPLTYLRRLSGSHSLSTSTAGCRQIQIHRLQKHRVGLLLPSASSLTEYHCACDGGCLCHASSLSRLHASGVCEFC